MRENIEEILQSENIEIKLLLEAIYLKYGYDFRNYAKAHLKRRIERKIKMLELSSISKLQEEILYSKEKFIDLLHDLTINQTEFFRRPSFYNVLRKDIIPILKTYPSLNIWHAGCASGEEVYSLGIILKEEGLLKKTKIYATDIDEKILKIAKEGQYSLSSIKLATSNYQKSGGLNSFSDYYSVKNDYAIIKDEIKKKIVFEKHNLVTDKVFIDANLILCRNVMIYFNKELKSEVMNMFYETLVHGGILGLGSQESLINEYKMKFESISENENIFKKSLGDHNEI